MSELSLVPRELYGAIEGGGSKFLCAVAHGPDEIVARTEIPTTSPRETLSAAGEFFAPFVSRGLRSVGLASFGPLDLTQGKIFRTPKPGWSDVGIAEILTDRIGVPLETETDVNAAALGERRWGAARGCEHVVYITVGTGVGVGIVVDGKAVHGRLHPELGHLPAPALDGFPGTCPFHGRCIEGVASAPALAAQLGVDPAQATDDDPIWQRTGLYLAHLVVASALCAAPERVLIGGGVAARRALWPSLLGAVSAHLSGYLPHADLAPGRISEFVVPPALGRDAGLMGALSLVVPE